MPPPQFGDPDFFLTGDVDTFEGNFITYDSLIIADDSNGSYMYEYDTTIIEFRQYLVKKVVDTIYLTFNVYAVNTSYILTPDKLNSESWYWISEFNQFKFSNDSLLVYGDFQVPPYVNGKWRKRSTRYVGIKQ